MKLPEGVKISTGANSYAIVSLNSLNHTVKLNSFYLQIYSQETTNKNKSHIGLKRGQITANVPKLKR